MKLQVVEDAAAALARVVEVQRRARDGGRGPAASTMGHGGGTPRLRSLQVGSFTKEVTSGCSMVGLEPVRRMDGDLESD